MLSVVQPVAWQPAQPTNQAPPREASRFDTLFHRLYPRLFGLAYRQLGDRLEAEDVLQEAFLRLADDPRLLARPDHEVAAWLSRVCLNLGSNRQRASGRAHTRLQRVARLELAEAHDSDSPATAALRHEAQTAVRAALAALPERQRAVLLLRHAGYSYAEVAAALDVAVGSVGVLLARAERAFRDHYQESDHP